jgi:hypothetical protein
MTWQNSWSMVGMAALAIVITVASGSVAYWHTANQLPSYFRPAVVLPRPNAYNDFAAAAAMCRAVGGSGLDYGERQVPPGRLRAVVARNRAALARLRQGLGKQSCAPPVVSFEQTFPEFGGFRPLAHVLVAEGKLAEHEGRMADAARSYRDCLCFAVEMSQGGTLLHGSGSQALQNIGLRALEESIDRLDAPTTARLAREFLVLDSRSPRLADLLANEKEAKTACLVEALRHGTVWQVFWPDDSLLSHALAWREFGLGLPSKRNLLAQYRSYMDAGIKDASRPYYLRTVRLPYQGVVELVAPDLGAIKAEWSVREARWRIMELRLAARAYQLQHGRPAGSAASLVPGYLPAVPRDPFADRPLVYRVKGNQVIVYSRGPDGKDDGGRDLGNEVYPGTSGDIVTLKERSTGTMPLPLGFRRCAPAPP